MTTIEKVVICKKIKTPIVYVSFHAIIQRTNS